MKKTPVKTWSTPLVAEEKKSIPCNLCGSLKFKPALFCEGFSYVRCAACALVQMNPQPVGDAVKKRYGAAIGAGPRESRGEDYLAYELANENAFLNLELLALKDSGFDSLEEELLRQRGEEVLPAPENAPHAAARAATPGKKPAVLDIGCATGSLLARLRERGWETTGVEISAPQAEYARQKRNLDVRSLPLEENHFPGAGFNVVLASHLIEHLNDPAALVREVRRVLVPGGRFFVTTPNIDGLQARLFKGRWRSAIFDHLYLFSRKTLSRLLRDNGFTVEKTVVWGGLAAGTAPAPVKRFFDKAAKRFGFGDVMILRTRRTQ